MSPALPVNIIMLSITFISIINLSNGNDPRRLPRPGSPRPGTPHLSNSPSSQFVPKTYTLENDPVIKIDRPAKKVSPLRRAKKIHRLERTRPVGDLREAFANGANSNVACARHSSVDKFLNVVNKEGEEKVIGQGGFGEIVRVIHEDTKKFYVKKKMRSDKPQNQNEIAVVKRIENSPGICPFIVIFEAYEECAPPEKDGHSYIYLIMEEIRGGDMFDHLADYKRITSTLALLYTYQIVLALKYLHDNGIIYRDIKDENVMMLVSWDEETKMFRFNGRIKLIDFGLSLIGEESNVLAGTVRYLAPEVLQRKKYGKTIDFWSLGVLVYRMIYGDFPFREPSASSSESDEMNMKNISRFAQGNSNMVHYPSYIYNDPKCISFIKACLTVDPSKRVTSEGTGPRNVLNQRWISDNRNGFLSKVHDPKENLMQFTKNELMISYDKFDREEATFPEQRQSFAARMAQQNQHINTQPNVITVTRTPGDPQNSHPNGYKTVIMTPSKTD